LHRSNLYWGYLLFICAMLGPVQAFPGTARADQYA
jgi:hypothetical protein